MPNVQLKQNA